MALAKIHPRVFLRLHFSTYKSKTINFNKKLNLSYFSVVLSMKSAYFYNEPDTNKLSIQVYLENEIPKINKTLNFERKMSECAEVFLERLKGRVSSIIDKKLQNKKLKKKENSENSDSSVVDANFFCNNQPISNDIIFEDIFRDYDNKNLVLNISGIEYKVLFNNPQICEIELPKTVKVGCPLSPCKLLMKSSDWEQSEFTWYKRISNSKPWIQCGEGFFYTPKEEDLHYHLKLVCVPRNKSTTGASYHIICEEPVKPWEFAELIKKRHSYIQSKADNNTIRIVSYNILADVYTNTKEAKTTLFTYCKPDILDFEYRKGLLLMELSGYQADILCLQEVDRKFYNNFLCQFFLSKNFASAFHEKEGSREGCALFCDSTKLKILSCSQHIYSEELNKNPIFKDVKQIIYKNEKLVEKLNSIQTQIQVGVLLSVTNKNDLIVIGNTHLYFHPDADHIRLLQGIMGFKILLQKVEEVKQQNPEKNVSVIFCGDFNSTPDCGLYKLMTTGFVESNVIDWKSSPGEEIMDVSYGHALNMESACGTPLYTNFTEGFKACLDYIYFQTDRLKVESYVPFPTLEDLQREVAIPSSYFPSDHIALIVDLKWQI